MHCYASFRLACRCANKAAVEGYKYFGLRNWGECWGEKDAGKMEAILSDVTHASQECLGNDYRPCDNNATSECVGKAHSTYVYSFHPGIKTNFDTC